MLKNFPKSIPPQKDELQMKLKEEAARLSAFQLKIKEAKLPVMAIFEGWGSAGKGSVIGSIIKNIDPRFFKVSSLEKPRTEEEKRFPFLYRYFVEIPEAGKFQFFDTYWMKEVSSRMLKGELTDNAYEELVHSINTTERQLTDNGYLVVKFFLHIERDEQKKRLDNLRNDKNTKWQVNEFDLAENRQYDRCLKTYGKFLRDTNRPSAPWYIIDASSKKWALLQVLQFLNQAIETSLKNQSLAVPILQNVFPLSPVKPLGEIPLDKAISEEEYKKELKKLQSRLHELHYKLYRRKIPVIIAYEGWDAAGKGGNIKRITGALDPRGYIVHPIASPEPHEKARHYLWRFWNRLPKTGHIAIFDRTWYGRVMVERLEGFCSENDWQRAYNEINEFENELAQWGAVIIKFWVQIDNATQLKRFTDRQNTPEKQWKITDEDWRNREKWDLYESAINEMIQKTSTTFAPWYILESVDKKYARIKALKTVLNSIENAFRKN